MNPRWLQLLALSVALAGCMHGRLSGLAAPGPDERAAEVVVIRTSNVVGATNSYLLTVDGRSAWGIRAGEYARLKVTAGPHRVGVECFGGWAPIWRESDAVDIRVEADAIVYLLVSPDLNCASIKAIADEAGRDWVGRSKPSPPE
jgi:hypothetical protein